MLGVKLQVLVYDIRPSTEKDVVNQCLEFGPVCVYMVPFLPLAMPFVSKQV